MRSTLPFASPLSPERMRSSGARSLPLYCGVKWSGGKRWSFDDPWPLASRESSKKHRNESVNHCEMVKCAQSATEEQIEENETHLEAHRMRVRARVVNHEQVAAR